MTASYYSIFCQRTPRADLPTTHPSRTAIPSDQARIIRDHPPPGRRGYDTDQIANDIGMSRPLVDHYMRFKDQMEVATAGRERLRLVD
jgi:hypothetical protein